MEFLAMFNVFIIIITTLVLLFNLLKKYRNTRKIPPGPWKLPLIGNMHQLYGGLPHHILRDMAKEHGPLMQLQLGEIPLVVVSSPRLAKEVLKTHDPVFAGRPSILAVKIMFYDDGDILGYKYDDGSRQMRKIWSYELLNAKTVRLLAPVRQDEGVRLTASIRNSSSAGETINLSEKISQYTMSVVCRAAFGRVIEEQDEFIKLINQFAILASGFDIADLFPSFKALHFLSGMMPKLLKIHKKIDNFLEVILEEHNRNFTVKRCSGEGGEEDLIDCLLRVKESGNLEFPITNRRMKAIIFVSKTKFRYFGAYFGAGSETSTTATIWAMSEFIRNPRVMTKAQNEIRTMFSGKDHVDEVSLNELKYLSFVIKETLRLHPPAPLLVPRKCMEDYVIDGYNIPAKTKLMVNAWAIGRDPVLWPDPDSFIPERFENSMTDFMGNNFELIPFGAGKRICPGIILGLANLKLPLALLLYHFNWELPRGMKAEDFDLTEFFGGTCGRKNDLCVIPTNWM